MERVKVVIAASDDEMRYEIRNLLNPDMAAVVAMSRMGTAAIDKAASLQPEVIILKGSKTDSEYILIAERIYETIPGTAIIAIVDEIDNAATEHAMAAGIRKILQWPVTAKVLTDTVTLIAQIERKRNSGNPNRKTAWESKVFTVFGTKGGIGKTTTAVNIAVALSQMGKKVALLDLDLQFGDAAVILDIESKDTITELVQERGSLDIDTIKNYMTMHSSGVTILSAPKSPEYAEIVKPEHVEKIITNLRPYYDYIIVDTPPAFDDTTLAAVENSNLVLFIVQLDIATLRNTRISQEIFKNLNQGDKIRIIINRDIDGGISVSDTVKVLGRSIFFRLGNDWKISLAALNKGIPAVIYAPRSGIADQYRKLAKALSEVRD